MTLGFDWDSQWELHFDGRGVRFGRDARKCLLPLCAAIPYTQQYLFIRTVVGIRGLTMGPDTSCVSSL